MAHEIALQIYLQVRRNGDALQCRTADSLDMIGTRWQRGDQTLTTSPIPLPAGAVVNAGYIYVRSSPKNTANVVIGIKPEGGEFIECQQLKPGQPVIFKAGANAYFLKAAADAQLVDVAVIED